MFGFLTKKYKNKIARLERQIENMEYEWDLEHSIYDADTREKFYQHKIDLVIGGIDLTTLRAVHRPLYGLSFIEALGICNRIEKLLKKENIICETSYRRKKDGCYIINIKVVDPYYDYWDEWWM